MQNSETPHQDAQPASPERKPLTDEQIELLWARHADTAETGKRRLAFGRAVEAATIATTQEPRT